MLLGQRYVDNLKIPKSDTLQKGVMADINDNTVVSGHRVRSSNISPLLLPHRDTSTFAGWEIHLQINSVENVSRILVAISTYPASVKDCGTRFFGRE